VKALFFFLFLALVSVHAKEEEAVPDDFNPAVDNISDKYYAGSWLIYDCKEGHWVCVLEEYYKTCEDERKQGITAKEKHLPCAPIGGFPTKRSCFQRELYLTGNAHGNRFCLLDELKKEELE
jgi:hypothetical protein